ncbi:hypothetical protein GQ55_3G065400 [Panicum hallii var. hallii]|uniref:Uncharacterized protein n=1 Tax=Panicum hallii var. hallii TaxID=1504633 RepID=A0A2T7E6F9_9POAL|nr:hypothetical protein GQ55_3G065400 [Panicum hallii var. hallii]
MEELLPGEDLHALDVLLEAELPVLERVAKGVHGVVRGELRRLALQPPRRIARGRVRCQRLSRIGRAARRAQPGQQLAAVGEAGRHGALQPHPLLFQAADAAAHGVAPCPEAGLQRGQGMDVPVDAAAEGRRVPAQSRGELVDQHRVHAPPLLLHRRRSGGCRVGEAEGGRQRVAHPQGRDEAPHEAGEAGARHGPVLEVRQRAVDAAGAVVDEGVVGDERRRRRGGERVDERRAVGVLPGEPHSEEDRRQGGGDGEEAPRVEQHGGGAVVAGVGIDGGREGGELLEDGEDVLPDEPPEVRVLVRGQRRVHQHHRAGGRRRRHARRPVLASESNTPRDSDSDRDNKGRRDEAVLLVRIGKK